MVKSLHTLPNTVHIHEQKLQHQTPGQFSAHLDTVAIKSLHTLVKNMYTKDLYTTFFPVMEWVGHRLRCWFNNGFTMCLLKMWPNPLCQNLKMWPDRSIPSLLLMCFWSNSPSSLYHLLSLEQQMAAKQPHNMILPAPCLTCMCGVLGVKGLTFSPPNIAAHCGQTTPFLFHLTTEGKRKDQQHTWVEL